MATPVESLFSFGIDVLKTSVDKVTRTVLAQLGDVVQEINEGDGAEWWQHVGLVSRPPRPVAKKLAAQVIAIKRRARDIVIASRDHRGLELAGEIADGETCVYAAGEDGQGQARILLKKDGSIHAYSRRGNDPGGTGMVMQLDAASNAIRLLNADGFGIIIDESGVRLTAKDSALTLGADGGIKMIGKGFVQIDGSHIHAGSLAVPVVHNVLRGPTGIAGTPSVKFTAE